MKNSLDNVSTKAPDEIRAIGKDKIKAKTQEMYVEIEELHKRMRAENKHAILIVFQGMDASGKDGSIDKLYNGLYPMATEAHGFKAPNDFEASKDYLWRIHNLVPSKGHIGIFNRSHYEDILVPTVHKLFPSEDIEKRYKHINNFEEMLEETGTHVIKFYLHISKEEQEIRFKERQDSIEKRWKYNSNDISESKLWDDYMNVYENIFKKSKIKWNVIPADNKWFRDYVIAQIILDKMKSLDMEYPEEIN
jgi:PPK2 family polyphosphate:nucleotide phosphotransferase